LIAECCHQNVASSAIRPYKFKTGEAFEIEALPFGLSYSPYWAHRLAKPILSWVRNTLQDVTVVWYVDDIAILGSNAEAVERAAARLMEFLTDLGVQVNAAKTMSRAATKIDYLGQVIDLTTGSVTPPAAKVRKAIAMAKKQAKARTCVPRHLARLVGVLLDLKPPRAQSLLGLLKLLMKETAHVVKSNRASAKSLQKAWSTSGRKRPSANGVINEAIKALKGLISARARPQPGPAYVLETDASDAGWGASVYRLSPTGRRGREIHAAALRWTPEERQLHITAREALAASYGTAFLVPRLPEVGSLTLHSNSTPTVWAWRNGSSKPVISKAARQATSYLASRGTFCRWLFRLSLQNVPNYQVDPVPMILMIACT